jgi:alpha-N-acetylglucosaminidase
VKKILLAVMICAAAAVNIGLAPTNASRPEYSSGASRDVECARGLVERLLPDHAKRFVLEIIPRDTAGDVFEIESGGGRVILRGNNGVSLASALNWYLKYHCGCQFSLTGGSQLRLPEPLPAVTPKVRRVASAHYRYFLNYCCFGYSLPWYDWPQWERLIDWMALNGVNLPLSVTGQEAVWQAVGRRLGWSEPVLQSFLAGPPYLPFGWMGCLDGHGGPLSSSWIERHAELQKKILERQRAFGMTPVLQGFTGHVPAAIASLYPGAKLQKIAWAEWNTQILDPLDPLFSRLAAAFLEEQNRLFGTDHYYASDTFIEMTPPSGDIPYLADLGGAIFDGLRRTDPEAVWVLQGWPFFFAREFWTQPRIEAVLGPVPDERMLVLDLFCENTPVWSRTRAFCGKPWLWCNIQNFGGNVRLGGRLDRINGDYWAARKDSRAGRLSGLGFVNEGLDNNPIVFDLLFEAAWRREPVRLEAWLGDYCRRAYGRRDPRAEAAWDILRETAFQSPFNGNAACTDAPSLDPAGAPVPRNDRLAEAWQRLLAAADDLGEADPFRFDLVNVARQVLANHSAELHRQVLDAYNAKNPKAFRTATAKFLTLIGDLDALLATRKEFLLGPWLEDARRWGATGEERDRLEWNARRVLTLWGNGTALRDYACRQWSGLLSGFYSKRWGLFFEHLDGALAGGKPFDAAAFARAMFAFEDRWSGLHDHYPSQPSGDSIEEARRLWATYGEAVKSGGAQAGPSGAREP